MTTALLPDLSISMTQRRWSCVLDPTLTLSDYGLLLVKQLGELMELWVVREFWHILDNTQFYRQQPELIIESEETERSQATYELFSQQIIRALKEWERLRTTTDRGSWNINFLADVLGESCVPVGTDSGIIWRWESLAQSLDRQLDEPLAIANPLTLAYRDLAALAAARPACVLTYRLSEEVEKNLPPRLCKTLEAWQIPCREIALNDSLAMLERDQFRQILIQAGLSKLLWAGLDLVILHLIVPASATLSPTFDEDWAEDLRFSEDAIEVSEHTAVEAELWQGAQGFWYSI